jgi:hypothetical protein
MGIDTVISTVTGDPQLRLIEAAVQCRVRRFAPAEFEGQPGLRGQNVMLDRGKNAALALLQHYQGYIQYTVFVCGILYERFSVNGMLSHHMGNSTGYGNEGDYIANPRNMTALAPVWDAAHNLSCVCLTSAYDVAQFVVRAIDMPTWAQEMSMYGERMTVNDLVEVIRACRSGSNMPLSCPRLSLTPNQIDHGLASSTKMHQVSILFIFFFVARLTREDLQFRLDQAQVNGHGARYRRLAPLVATAEGRFDFVTPGYLNSLNPDIEPTPFRDWFLLNWAAIP